MTNLFVLISLLSIFQAKVWENCCVSRGERNIEAWIDSCLPLFAVVIFRKNKRQGRKDGGKDMYPSKILFLPHYTKDP